jgi:hypothetical protein
VAVPVAVAVPLLLALTVPVIEAAPPALFTPLVAL